MADNKQLGYEQTLLYGKYTKELSEFAKFEASKRFVVEESIPKKRSSSYTKVAKALRKCADVRDIVFLKVGEDWIFLTILGVVMAILSFAMDFIIEKCQEAKFWLYEELQFSVGLQYFAWIMYSLLFILFAVGFTHLVSPQAIGSGIPEMKTILRGVVLKEYLTFRTLVAKVIGLCSSLGSTLPFGKEGPFVHIASIVATLLSKAVGSFRGIYENESRRSEMLASACAVGVAGTFAAPIGGVLFSIEVTATYFAVRNYWRGFFSAVCGALMFRLMAFWFKDEETITALFKTNLRTEFPFDALELFAFAAIGVACGFGGALFILAHRSVILFTRRHKRLSRFLQKNRFIYPSIITFVISSLTFPPGLGQFFAGQLTGKMAINELFSNITWTLGQAEDLDDEAILSHWRHPLTNIYITLVLFIIMNFLMAVFSNTLPIPAGVFVPVFTIGAAFGRLVGESMAAWFPEGIPSGDVMRKIVPGGYAVVGAASLSGSVTRTISTAVIVFEITGQISHVLPAVISVLISNAVANVFQPSFYDSIIKLKRLPYLPDIVSTKSNAWLLYVEDFMEKKVSFIAFGSTYRDLQDVLMETKHRSYPLVDSKDSKILLGSIQRFELERLLLVHLSHEKKVLWSQRHRISHPIRIQPPIVSEEELNLEKEEGGGDKQPETTTGGTSMRFRVTKVDEPDGATAAAALENGDGASANANHNNNGIPMQLLNVPQRRTTHQATELQQPGNCEDSQYNTIHVPLRSILKKSTSTPQMCRARSTGDLKAEVNNFYRKLAKQRKENILEDVPFTIDKGSMQALYKKVKLPHEPSLTKIGHLPVEDQEAWKERQLSIPIDWEGVQIDPAPFQLVERTSLHKVHSLFSLLGLSHAFVTNTGRLAGVVGVRELRNAVQGQIELQENRKAAKGSDSSLSSLREEEMRSPEDIEEEEEESAPFDSVNLEIDRDAPKPFFRLKRTSSGDKSQETET